jgi:hypothetical protein
MAIEKAGAIADCQQLESRRGNHECLAMVAKGSATRDNEIVESSGSAEQYVLRPGSANTAYRDYLYYEERSDYNAQFI